MLVGLDAACTARFIHAFTRVSIWFCTPRAGILSILGIIRLGWSCGIAIGIGTFRFLTTLGGFTFIAQRCLANA